MTPSGQPVPEGIATDTFEAWHNTADLRWAFDWTGDAEEELRKCGYSLCVAEVSVRPIALVVARE